MYSVSREKSLKTALAPWRSSHVPEYLIKAVTELPWNQSVSLTQQVEASLKHILHGLWIEWCHVSREGFSEAF